MTMFANRARPRPNDVLIEVDSVTKAFSTTDGEAPVLDAVSLAVHAGEVVALLGRSGSGKSTLLRCMAGLLAPTSGSVRHRGAPLAGPNPDTTMVFQSFALLPWLTVRQNVELGLEARSVGRAERRDRAERAIDLIGLDGFEDAYPKELSGGMRQRVGFARALVVEPEILLMDEPFSALDVLTTENLRGELMELWASDGFPIESIVLVTHDIEEAVLLADRVVILGSNPGRVRAEFPVDLPRPRDRKDPAFDQLVHRIYEVMTAPEPRATAKPAGHTAGAGHTADGVAHDDRAPTHSDEPATLLPHATVDSLSGLAEVLLVHGPQLIADTAEQLALHVDDLLPAIDALDLLGFASVQRGLLDLTPAGRTFAGADIQASKRIFAQAALAAAPLVRDIAEQVDREADGTIDADLVRRQVRTTAGRREAQVQLDVASDWGRYAEQFTYDADHDEFVADPDHVRILTEGGA